MRLMLGDGTIVEGGSAGLASGELFLWFPGYTMQQAAEKAFAPAIMCRVLWAAGEDEEIYTGYTECYGLRRDDNENAIIVTMRKGVSE